MGKKYLFSPIGNTDPIKYFYDGSMLHICRYYKPDIVYLYLSKEMIENHERDNRYVKTLELLGEYLNHTFEIHVIENSDMIDVQQYDVFYNEFKKIIEDIEYQMEEEDTLFVNMASGTPAMKSALLVMATLAEYRFMPVQVSTPKKKSNKEYESRDDYDVELIWDLNEDNEEGAENRCEEVRCLNLVRLLKIDIIKKHLLSYDYRAAAVVGQDMKQDLSEEAYQWLETAAARASLDWKKMNQVLPKGNRLLTAVSEKNLERTLFEYTLILDLKIKRKEYADFLRAITPLSVDLLEIVIEKYCGVNISDYYKGEQANRKWVLNKLKGTKFYEIMRAGSVQSVNYIYSWQLKNIIDGLCDDSILKQRIQELLEVERKARNIVAHNIVSVTDDWVKEQTGKKVSEIMWLIKYICEKAGVSSEKSEWNAYDKMNEYIIKRLEK